MVKKKACIFISGTGSNLKSIINSSRDPNFPIKINLVLTNNKNAAGINYAKKYSIPFKIINDNKKKFERIAFKEIIEKKIKLICLAGFMKILSPTFIKKWKERLINIHPSYLPHFKGLNAQSKAIEAKASFSGCTVHYVNKKIDSGNIIKQKKIKILKKDNTESLTKKILIEEHKLYPKALNVVVNRLLLNEKIN